MSATIRLNGQTYDFFNRITINRHFNASASTFKFSAFFDSNNPEHRNIFRPLSFPAVAITSSLGERLLTGVVLRHNFSRAAETRMSSLSGYSLTGVLSDCPFPIESYPLHYTNVTFAELGRRALSFFNLGFVVENEFIIADEIIPEITARPGIKVYQFLSEIAAQRNLVLTHDAEDNLVVTRPRVNQSPVATFRQDIPVTEISMDANGQRFFDSITVMKQADIENDNVSQATIRNDLVGSYRPLVSLYNVGNDVTVEDAARNVRANQLREVRVQVKTDRWTWLRNDQLETMAPNNIVSIIAPDIYIFNRTNFFVESVELNLDNEKETAVLTCVLPQAYNNQNPINIF